MVSKMKNKLVNSLSFISFNSFSILFFLFLFIFLNNNCLAFNYYSSFHNNYFAFISIHDNFSSEYEDSFSNYYFLFGIVSVILFLLSAFSFYLIFRLYKKFDSLNYQYIKLKDLFNPPFDYSKNKPNFSPHKVENTNDNESYFVSDYQNLDTAEINNDDMTNFNPSSSNTPNQEPIIKYIELPEKDGFFLNKYLTDKEERRSLYKIVFHPNSDQIEFDLLVNKTNIHRNVMDNHSAVLKPACDYVTNPDPGNSKIIKTDSNLGTLIQENDKLKIVNKLKISFQ